MQIHDIRAPLGLICIHLLLVAACTASGVSETSKSLPVAFLTEEIQFLTQDGTQLVGQLDRPANLAQPPLIFIIHHSGAVDRYAYQYLAERLIPAGWAVFRFDKRGTGKSGGIYGCCEAEDAVAAYQAAVQDNNVDTKQVYIIAQSIGSKILAARYQEFANTQHPVGVLLLSSLLEGEDILSIRAPLHIIISDSEVNVTARSQQVVNLHQATYRYGASYFIVPHTEHTLFDISEGPIDWEDPTWPTRFSELAWVNMLNWLTEMNQSSP